MYFILGYLDRYVSANELMPDIWASHVLISEQRLFPSVVRQKLSDRKVLFVGDSLTRRLTATTAMYINITDDKDAAVVDFDDHNKLLEGFHDFKSWQKEIHKFNGKQINICFKWSPQLPPVSSLDETNVLNLIPKYSAVVYFVSSFHQKYYKSVRFAGIASGQDSDREVYKALVLSFFEKVCQQMSKNSKFLLGVSPMGDYSDLRNLRFKNKMNPLVTGEQVKALNRKQSLKERKRNLIKFDEMFYEILKETYISLLSSKSCNHVSLSFLDHYAMFNKRTQGTLRNKGDSMFHFGSTTRIYRMLSVLKELM